MGFDCFFARLLVRVESGRVGIHETATAAGLTRFGSGRLKVRRGLATGKRIVEM